MSTTSNFSVRLLKPHTHSGKKLAAGDVIPAKELNATTATWLLERKIGENAETKPVANNSLTKKD